MKMTLEEAEKGFVQEKVWFGQGLFLTVTWSPFGELKYYMDSYTNTNHTDTKERKKKISRTLRLVAARRLCKFNQYFPHGQRNPLSNWPQTKRSKSQTDRQKNRFLSPLGSEQKVLSSPWAKHSIKSQ